jgi:signal transduction histidine kinase
MASVEHNQVVSNELSDKLEACEASLRRNHQLALAGRLVSATMHEVNNRLAALANFIYLAKINSVSESDSLCYLGSAEEQLRMLGEITAKNLSFIRTDMTATEIDLVELANEALNLHAAKIAIKRIDVHNRSADRVLASAKRGEILQVVFNLLHNAIDALAHSGDLHIRITARSDKAIITIADNGSGIPEELHKTLFQSFKSTKESGNGIGLWLVKQIIDGHNGRIQFRTSTDSRRSGTIFRITLPIEHQKQPNLVM